MGDKGMREDERRQWKEMCNTLEHLKFGPTWQCPFKDNIHISASKADKFLKLWYF